MKNQARITSQLLILNGTFLVVSFGLLSSIFGGNLGLITITAFIGLWLWNLRKVITDLKPRAIALDVNFITVFLVLIPYLGILFAIWFGKKLSATVTPESIENAKKSGSGNFRSF